MKEMSFMSVVVGVSEEGMGDSLVLPWFIYALPAGF